MDAKQAMKLALWYLDRRARTEKELREKLERKQIPLQEIEAVLLKLKEYGYINDQKYVADFQRSKDTYKPMGTYRLRQELYKKGVPKDIVQTVSASKEKEIELALEAAKTRLRQYGNLEPDVFRRRMTGFLARRGFGYDTIKQVFICLERDEDL